MKNILREEYLKNRKVNDLFWDEDGASEMGLVASKLQELDEMHDLIIKEKLMEKPIMLEQDDFIFNSIMNIQD